MDINGSVKSVRVLNNILESIPELYLAIAKTGLPISLIPANLKYEMSVNTKFSFMSDKTYSTQDIYPTMFARLDISLIGCERKIFDEKHIRIASSIVQGLTQILSKYIDKALKDQVLAQMIEDGQALLKVLNQSEEDCAVKILADIENISSKEYLCKNYSEDLRIKKLGESLAQSGVRADLVAEVQGAPSFEWHNYWLSSILLVTKPKNTVLYSFIENQAVCNFVAANFKYSDIIGLDDDYRNTLKETLLTDGIERASNHFASCSNAMEQLFHALDEQPSTPENDVVWCMRSEFPLNNLIYNFGSDYERVQTIHRAPVFWQYLVKIWGGEEQALERLTKACKGIIHTCALNKTIFPASDQSKRILANGLASYPTLNILLGEISRNLAKSNNDNFGSKQFLESSCSILRSCSGVVKTFSGLIANSHKYRNQLASTAEEWVGREIRSIVEYSNSKIAPVDLYGLMLKSEASFIAYPQSWNLIINRNSEVSKFGRTGDAKTFGLLIDFLRVGMAKISSKENEMKLTGDDAILFDHIKKTVIEIFSTVEFIGERKANRYSELPDLLENLKDLSKLPPAICNPIRESVKNTLAQNFAQIDDWGRKREQFLLENDGKAARAVLEWLQNASEPQENYVRVAIEKLTNALETLRIPQP